MTDLVGQVLDGKYRVDQPLGRGGMGAVFRATHLGTDRTVALKVIHATLAGDPAYLERFRREARACGRLRHQNIVDVTDFGVCAHRGGQLAYLVMEFLDGCTLADVLQDEPIPPLTWTIDILEQVCAAVEEAHRQGILHRDLKPDNVWLEPNRRGGYSVKVLDFGLAKLETQGPATLPMAVSEEVRAEEARAEVVADTADGATYVAPAPADATFATAQPETHHTGVAGTPGYMSPEQATAGAVTARTDVYSLGVLAFRMLTGREPFTGSASEVMRAHVHTPPPSIRELEPSVPADAADLVMAALSKDPAARPASAGQFGNMLAGRLEPPGTSVRKAMSVLFERLPIFLTISVACFLPMLVWSVVLALWAGAQGAGLVPSLPRAVAVLPLAVFGIFIAAGVFAMSVTPVLMLHAMAAPQRPISIATLREAYGARVRTWIGAMAPIIWPQMLALLLIIVGWSTSSALRPWTRTLDGPLRAGFLLALMVPGFACQWWSIRRLGTKLHGAGFLAPVMLVEGLDFDAARQRAIALAANGGRLQKRGQRLLFVSFVLVGVVSGMLVSRGRMTMMGFATMAPLIALLVCLGMMVISVLTSMTYFTARRASGESIDQALGDFERAALPATHWQRSHRERVMSQLSSSGATSAARKTDSQAETRRH